MSPLSLIFDASPLIALDDIRLLTQMESMFENCLTPSAVAREVAPTVRLPSWIGIQPLTAPVPTEVQEARLGLGETETIALALSVTGFHVALDDRSARRLARELGLTMIGTLGLLVRAREAGVIDRLRPRVEELLATGFFISDRLVERALREAGEW